MKQGEEIVSPGQRGQVAAVATPSHAVTLASRQAGKVVRAVALDNVRGFAVLLVVLHHSLLAYTTFVTFDPQNPISASPVVDGARWAVFDYVVSFNDIFFMSLLFFVSGLFVWSSLRRKGALRFVRDRVLRLAVPFVVALFVLIPLAYYPAFLEAAPYSGYDPNYLTFWGDAIRRGWGTAGPLWFVWVLLLFSLLAALVYLMVSRRPRSISEPRRRALFERPWLFFVVILQATALVYFLSVNSGLRDWIGAGPFWVQSSRIVFYLLWFAAGVGFSAYGLDRGMFRTGGPLARRWWLWVGAACCSFAVAVVVAKLTAAPWQFQAYLFALTAATAVLGVCAAFIRFTRRNGPFMGGLSGNSYGIYLVHYAPVLWLQYSLLNVGLPAVVKGLVVFAAATAASWTFVFAIRRVPYVAKYV